MHSRGSKYRFWRRSLWEQFYVVEHSEGRGVPKANTCGSPKGNNWGKIGEAPDRKHAIHLRRTIGEQSANDRRLFAGLPNSIRRFFQNKNLSTLVGKKFDSERSPNDRRTIADRCHLSNRSRSIGERSPNVRRRTADRSGSNASDQSPTDRRPIAGQNYQKNTFPW